MKTTKQKGFSMKRYRELKAKLNPHNDKFIVMGNTPDWIEFNQLSGQYLYILRVIFSGR